MKKNIGSYVLFFSLLLSINPNYLWAADASTQTKASPGAAGLIGLATLVVCVMRRNNAIGGWLLFYFIRLYMGFIITLILVLPNLSNFSPQRWEDTRIYSLYLLTTIPLYLTLLAQIILSFKLGSKKREWKYINILIIVLLIDLIFNLISIPIDLVYWPDNIYITIYSLIWPLIWLPYFKFSKRVKHVYRDNDWDIAYIKEIAKV